MDRTEFMDIVYDLLKDDPDNNRANEIIEAADEYVEDAVKEALEGKDTNVPTNSALDHIHNVVRDDAYRRGYEQGKADAIKWIPIKTRPLTEEEKEEYPGWDCYLDCELPDGGQEILITYKNGNKKMVCEDTFFNDDCCYLDSGLELGEDVLAWAKKPEPWKGEKADGQN